MSVDLPYLEKEPSSWLMLQAVRMVDEEASKAITTPVDHSAAFPLENGILCRLSHLDTFPLRPRASVLCRNFLSKHGSEATPESLVAVINAARISIEYELADLARCRAAATSPGACDRIEAWRTEALHAAKADASRVSDHADALSLRVARINAKRYRDHRFAGEELQRHSGYGSVTSRRRTTSGCGLLASLREAYCS